jgi:hypothetical protein
MTAAPTSSSRVLTFHNDEEVDRPAFGRMVIITADEEDLPGQDLGACP